MAGSRDNRKKQLSHSCNEIVCLCRHPLATSNKYVQLGEFSTDPLEKGFGKLRPGSGGTYLINVQQCTESCILSRHLYF